ncbi:hypothetical protein BDA99DRAFT_434490, partial [Phascolomyces articulosus]
NEKKKMFDNAEELYKIKKIYPDSGLIICIATNNANVISSLNRKFESSVDMVDHLLQTAKD